MDKKRLNYHIKKINRIIDSDYDHETPDVVRSKFFNKAFTKMVAEMFPNYTIVTSMGGYCETSGFIKNGDKYIYYHSDDYRCPIGSSWNKNILYRTAKDTSDYYGGSNHFADLEYLEVCIEKLFKTI